MYLKTLASTAVFAFVLAGCNNAKSPEQVAADTTKAEQKADAEVAKSVDSASKTLDKSAGKVDDELADFNNDHAKSAYKVAVAQADGDRKVSLAKCEALSGSAQSACKDQADADYKAAKANAKAASMAMKN